MLQEKTYAGFWTGKNLPTALNAYCREHPEAQQAINNAFKGA
jgi:hypothetical protein